MTTCMRCVVEESMPGAVWTPCPHTPDTCFVNGCIEPGTHLVDFTAVGEGWLPMCDEHKKMDEALMGLLKSSPEKAKLAEALITAVENERKQ